MAAGDDRSADAGVYPLAASSVEYVALRSGRRIDVEALPGGEEKLTIRSSGGACLLTVRLTDAGPVLSLAGAILEIAASERLSLTAGHLDIQAGFASIDVAGDLTERIAGNAVRKALGSAEISGHSARLEATRGSADVLANDDVNVRAERVRLNSDDPPMPLTWSEFEERQREAAARGPLGIPMGSPRAPDACRDKGAM